MAYADTILADSPIGYWRLGEPSGTAADNLGSGGATIDGTYVNTPTLGVTGALTGDADTAATFTRANIEYVTVPDAAAIDLGNGPFSYEIWFKRASGTYASTWTLFDKDTGAPALRLNLNNAGGFTGCDIWWGRAGQDCSCHSSVLVSDTDWHHLVGTKDASTNVWTLYLDGEDVTVFDQTFATIDTSTALTIGAIPAGDAFDGSLDEVAIYGAVLTASQVAAHYAAGTASGPVWTTPADTVAMTTTPDLKFTSPTSAAKQHFQMQLDTANTFNTGNLRTYDSSTVQTNWTYWDGASWTAMPSDGLPIAKSGNEVDYTVTSALSATTWYRRVRAGTLA